MAARTNRRQSHIGAHQERRGRLARGGQHHCPDRRAGRHRHHDALAQSPRRPDVGEPRHQPDWRHPAADRYRRRAHEPAPHARPRARGDDSSGRATAQGQPGGRCRRPPGHAPERHHRWRHRELRHTEPGEAHRAAHRCRCARREDAPGAGQRSGASRLRQARQQRQRAQRPAAHGCGRQDPAARSQDRHRQLPPRRIPGLQGRRQGSAQHRQQGCRHGRQPCWLPGGDLSMPRE